MGPTFVKNNDQSGAKSGDHTQLGEDLAEVAYIEVCARRLAARKAVEELELLKTLPGVDEHIVDDAKRTFAHWEEWAGIGLKPSVRTYPSTEPSCTAAKPRH